MMGSHLVQSYLKHIGLFCILTSFVSVFATTLIRIEFTGQGSNNHSEIEQNSPEFDITEGDSDLLSHQSGSYTLSETHGNDNCTIKLGRINLNDLTFTQNFTRQLFSSIETLSYLCKVQGSPNNSFSTIPANISLSSPSSPSSSSSSPSSTLSYTSPSPSPSYSKSISLSSSSSFSPSTSSYLKEAIHTSLSSSSYFSVANLTSFLPNVQSATSSSSSSSSSSFDFLPFLHFLSPSDLFLLILLFPIGFFV